MIPPTDPLQAPAHTPPLQTLDLQGFLVMPVLMLNGSCSSALCSLLSSTAKASKGIRSRVKQEWVEAGSSNSFSAGSWRRGKPCSEECGEGSFQCVEAAVLSALEEGLEP